MISLLKHVFKRHPVYYFVLSLLVLMITPTLNHWYITQPPLAYFNAYFWGTFETSYFSLFPWFAYVLIGCALYLIKEKILFKNLKNIIYLVFIITVFLFGLTVKIFQHLYISEDQYFYHGIHLFP